MSEATPKPEYGTPIVGYAAEKLAEAWLHYIGYHEVDRRKGATGLYSPTDSDGEPVIGKNGKPKMYSQKRDLFGCIDLAALSDDCIWMVQVTSDDGRSHRRRKIEKRRWPEKLIRAGVFRVSIIVHVCIRDVEDRRKFKHYWRVEDYRPKVSPLGLFTANPVEWEFHKVGLVEIDMAALTAKREGPTEEEKAFAQRALVALRDPAAMAALSKDDQRRLQRLSRRTRKK